MSVVSTYDIKDLSVFSVLQLKDILLETKNQVAHLLITQQELLDELEKSEDEDDVESDSDIDSENDRNDEAITDEEKKKRKDEKELLRLQQKLEAKKAREEDLHIYYEAFEENNILIKKKKDKIKTLIEYIQINDVFSHDNNLYYSNLLKEIEELIPSDVSSLKYYPELKRNEEGQLIKNNIDENNNNEDEDEDDGEYLSLADQIIGKKNKKKVQNETDNIIESETIIESEVVIESEIIEDNGLYL